MNLRRLLLAAAAVFAGLIQAAAQDRSINLFIWGEYIDPEVVKAFEKETGVRVVESNFSSNEELLAKLQAGGVSYDVITPSDYMVQVMRRQGLLRTLDASKLKGLAGLAEEVKGLAFDPRNEVSVPYKWGSTGIGYLKSRVKPAPTSWADLYDAAKLRKYRGRVSVLDDHREVINGALMYRGLPANSTDPKHLEQVRQVLLRQKPLLAKYDSSAYYESLAAGEIVMAMGYSQEIALAAAENDDVAFVLPKEGATFYMDTMAIPKTAREVEGAHAFIDFLLRPEISAQNANYTQGPSPVAAAQPLVEEAIRTGISYQRPPAATRVLINDVGEEEERLNVLWTEIKAK